MQLVLDSIDHVVLTVRDIEATIQFYRDVLGMVPEQFAGGRMALKFGNQKLNLHVAGREFNPKASAPTPGSADLCFLTSIPINAVIKELHKRGIRVVQGPISKTGAQGPLCSVYIRDPDRNLIEISNLLKD